MEEMPRSLFFLRILDEYQVIENPPLVIPPDLNLGSSQLERKDIKDVEQDLAKEILFGLDESK